MSERQAGWYWCKIKAPSQEWEPMRWDGRGLEMIGRGRSYYDGRWLDSVQVGPRIPTPDEHTPPVATRGY